MDQNIYKLVLSASIDREKTISKNTLLLPNDLLYPQMIC